MEILVNLHQQMTKISTLSVLTGGILLVNLDTFFVIKSYNAASMRVIGKLLLLTIISKVYINLRIEIIYNMYISDKVTKNIN